MIFLISFTCVLIVNMYIIFYRRGQETPLAEVIYKKKIRLTDITWEDISKSSTQGKIVWETAQQELLNRHRKIASLQRKVQRLRQKVSSFKLLTKNLLKKQLILKNEAKLLHVSNMQDTVTNI